MPSSTSQAISPAAPAASGTPALSTRQPPSLRMFFLSEMWERFGYYGMRALLVLYLTKAAGYTRDNALEVYAVYTGLVYIAPIFGGLLADRYLGFRKAILIGGGVMMLGHAAMAVPGLLNPALGLLVVGNGFFKPNMTSLLGQQYGEHDARRDGGFTIFYMGINLGAFLAPLVAGSLGERVDWPWGFASAAVGMAFGLAQFALGQARLGTTGMPSGRGAQPGRDATRLDARDWMHVGACIAAAVAAVAIALQAVAFGGDAVAATPWPLAAAALVALLAWLLNRARRGGGRAHVEQVAAILVLGFFNVFFWMGFEQAGGTMNLFADRLTDRMVFGWEIPASYFQSINALAILALAPGLSALWTRLETRQGPRGAPTSPTKMALGMIILGLGFVVLAVAQGRADRIGKVGPQWLAATYVLHTIGELCISPIGLSMVTRVSPPRMVGLMVGVWFGSFGVANYLAGRLEHLLAGSGIPLYGFLVGSSVGAGLLLLALVPLLKRWMHGHA